MKRRSRNPIRTNSGAIADVSFLLLIFFMVATTFNKDYKLNMILPPYSETKVKGPIESNRTVQLLLNAQNELMIENEPIKDKAIEVLTHKVDAIISRKKEAVIIVKMHPQTSYQTYIELLAKINAARNNLRKTMADRHFNLKYKECSIAQKNQIEQNLKIRISEQELQL